MLVIIFRSCIFMRLAITAAEFGAASASISDRRFYSDPQLCCAVAQERAVKYSVDKLGGLADT